MRYEFPIIRTIDDVLPALEGRDEFIVKHDVENGYKVINYLVNFADTFPDIADATSEEEARNFALRRECRGITFDAKTGKIVSRKYQKFFNLGERSETGATKLDFTKPHVILEKLDGSMITPLMMDDDTIRWCTKMGLTGVAAPVDEFVKSHPTYEEFAHAMSLLGKTPIFEWCSRKQRIVIDYPVDRLVLTAIRCNETGRYESYDFLVEFAKSFEVEVVRALPGSVENLQVFLDETRDLKGEEGYVIRWNDGMMVKAKSEEYCKIHKCLDGLRREKDVLTLILEEKLDDVKALLPADLGDAADRYGSKVFHSARAISKELLLTVIHAWTELGGSKKDFAVNWVNGGKIDKRLRSLAFSFWDNLDKGEEFAAKQTLAVLKNACSSQTKVDEHRFLMGGARWDDYVAGLNVPDTGD